MNRREKCEEERISAWDKSKNIQQRISNLKKVITKYPEFMTPYSDIAVSYLDTDDIENAVKTYQQIINKKATFKLIWDNNLGKAYLFTDNYPKAIETLKNSTVISYNQGLFLALSYLKNGDKKEAIDQFDKWISEDIEKSFEQYRYNKYLSTLLNDEEKILIENKWNEYERMYSSMEPYQLYCKLYKNHYLKSGMDDIDDDDFEIPPKYNKNKFEELSNEYLYLDRKSMFGDDMNDSDYDRYFELQDLLFAETIF